MEALRTEADGSAARVQELTAKVKTLEQENLQKEQEITSLQHRNSVLEKDNERIDGLHKDAKAAADQSKDHGTQAESLQRKLAVLEEEAEQADKQLRETTEKCVPPWQTNEEYTDTRLGFVSQMSRLVTTSVRSRLWNRMSSNGRRSTKRCPRNIMTPRRSSTNSWQRSTTSRRAATCLGVAYAAIVLLQDAPWAYYHDYGSECTWHEQAFRQRQFELRIP